MTARAGFQRNRLTLLAASSIALSAVARPRNASRCGALLGNGGDRASHKLSHILAEHVIEFPRAWPFGARDGDAHPGAANKMIEQVREHTVGQFEQGRAGPMGRDINGEFGLTRHSRYAERFERSRFHGVFPLASASPNWPCTMMRRVFVTRIPVLEGLRPGL
jgi:hypothetical protein